MRRLHLTDLQRVVLRHQLFDGEELRALVLKRSSVWWERMKSAWSHMAWNTCTSWIQSLSTCLLFSFFFFFMYIFKKTIFFLVNKLFFLPTFVTMTECNIKLFFGPVSSRASRTLVSGCLSVGWLVGLPLWSRMFSSVAMSKGGFLLTFPLVPSSGKKLECVQYSGLWPHTCKMNDIPSTSDIIWV